jgi:hypothetical protein
MPYAILKRKGKFVTVNEMTGKVHGTFDTKEKAVGQLRALYAAEKDASPLKNMASTGMKPAGVKMPHDELY